MDGGANAIRLLRRMAQRRDLQEHCELCATPVGEEHRHLLEVGKGGIVCACDACALTFREVVGGRFKVIPRDSRWLVDFSMSDLDWQMLGLPIHLAFVFEKSRTKGIAAIYPSPGGPTESVVATETWSTLKTKNPVLGSLEPDVEALLVNRVGEARDYFTAPIDACYGLVGLVRKHWRGLSGGEEVWEQLRGFFANLKERSEIVTGPRENAHA